MSDYPPPEELNALNDAELAEICAGKPEIERERLLLAATSLLIAKTRAGDKTPWRELVRLVRESEPTRTEVEIVDDKGAAGVQVAYIERGNERLKGLSAWMREASYELSFALRKIEELDPAAYVSADVQRHINSTRSREQHNRRGPSYKGLDAVVSAVLAKQKFKSSWSGWKGTAVMDVKTEWEKRYPGAPVPGDTTIRDMIKKLAE